MNEVDRARRLLEERGLSAALVAHCRGVATTAAELARRWGADPVGAEVAGLLHDSFRETPREEVLAAARKHHVNVDALAEKYPVQLLHGPVAGAWLATQGYAPEMCSAVARHTVGAKDMSVLDRCLFVADAVEPQRDFDGIAETREAARRCLDEAVALIAARDVARLEARGREVHPHMRALLQERDDT